MNPKYYQVAKKRLDELQLPLPLLLEGSTAGDKENDKYEAGDNEYYESVGT